jgi:hypothetical protein
MITANGANNTAASKPKAHPSLPSRFDGFWFHPREGGRVRLVRYDPAENDHKAASGAAKTAGIGFPKLDGVLSHVRRPEDGDFSAALVSGKDILSEAINPFSISGDRHEGNLIMFISGIVFAPFLESENEMEEKWCEGFEFSMVEGVRGSTEDDFIDNLSEFYRDTGTVLFVNACLKDGKPLTPESYAFALSRLVGRVKINEMLISKGMRADDLSQAGRDYFSTLYQLDFYESCISGVFGPPENVIKRNGVLERHKVIEGLWRRHEDLKWRRSRYFMRLTDADRKTLAKLMPRTDFLDPRSLLFPSYFPSKES